eukprot:SAG11_NODE_197_length_12691_cov_20.904145_5_plen_183_part_00
MDFLEKKEVKSQLENEKGRSQVQEYLEKQMGLDEWEMREVITRAGIGTGLADSDSMSEGDAEDEEDEEEETCAGTQNSGGGGAHDRGHLELRRWPLLLLLGASVVAIELLRRSGVEPASARVRGLHAAASTSVLHRASASVSFLVPTCFCGGATEQTSVPEIYLCYCIGLVSRRYAAASDGD